MKKLNRKGVTLVELIVSFAIVGVAIIYFFQTLTTVNKLYYKAREETNKFVDKDYALRIANAWADTKTSKEDILSGGSAANYAFIVPSQDNGTQDNGIYKIQITKKGETKVIATLYKYIK